VTTIGMTEARRQLEALVERAVTGETIIISKWGKPTVRLVPLDAPAAGSTDSSNKKP
jgi:prevent-host-death family protein